MAILVLKVLGTWSFAAVVMGFTLGAAIRRGDRIRKDEFLACVFASVEALQAYRSYARELNS
jgi:hypothetical protein